MSSDVFLERPLLGKYWNQPKREAILVDDTHAVMDEQAFNLLAEYSTTLPSGVYPGKMWKALSRGRWVLRWYGIVAGKTGTAGTSRNCQMVS